MPDPVLLYCPVCGNQMEFESNEHDIFCVHCGAQLLFQNGGLISTAEENQKIRVAKIDEVERLLSKQTSAVAIQTIEREMQNAHADIEKTTGSLGCIFWIGVGLFVISFLLLIPLMANTNNSDSNSGFGIVVWASCLLLGLGFVILGSVRQRRRRNKRQKEWVDYLMYLEEELAKHKRNVIS